MLSNIPVFFTMFVVGMSRLLKDGEGELRNAQEAMERIQIDTEELENLIKSKDQEVHSLQAEKEEKSSGEVKALIQETDALSKKYVASKLCTSVRWFSINKTK